MKFPYIHIILLLLVWTTTVNAWAQTTSVDGYITEEGSGESVMFAHILLKGSHIGTTSDTAGYFSFEIDDNILYNDSIIVSYLGFRTKTIGIVKGQKQSLDISLESEMLKLSEAVINPGVNPAWAMMENIIANKEHNNPESRDSYSCREYSKIRFDLNHFTEKTKNNILVRPFDFIWENADTTADGVTYLPVLLIEKLIDHYYQKSPKDYRDSLLAVQATGLKGPKIMQFAEDLYLTPNVYDNYVVILEKNFPSPINDNFKMHYKVYLTDSVEKNGDLYYQFIFKPKHKHELAFRGDMLVHAESWAVDDINLRFDIMANVNFVRSYWINQKYEEVEEGIWMPNEGSVIGDFTVVENASDLTGFFGRKNSTYKDYQINVDLSGSLFKGSILIAETDSAKMRGEEFWDEHRELQLNEEEKGVFEMEKRLNDDPKFILRKNLISAVFSGYIPWKQLKIGDFYSFYSFNLVEASRLKFGMKTADDIEIPLESSVYIAYGTRDERFKYGVDVAWRFDKNQARKKKIGFTYRNDIDQLGRSYNHIELDHVFISLIQYGDGASRNYVQDFTAFAENTWADGFVTRLRYFDNTISPTGGNKFSFLDENGTIDYQNEYKATGLGLTLKYSYQNTDLSGAYNDRKEKAVSFRKLPDLAIDWQMADKAMFASEFDFQKISFRLKQAVRTKKLGYFRYVLESGKTFGTVPYPYMNIPYGNEMLIHDELAFNLMNFLEYTSDEFATAHLEQHFDGLIMDRIPLLNKLKWRLFAFGKGYWGNTTSENNQGKYLYPEGLRAMNGTYYEAGFGIENIFKIAKVDFTWRLTDSSAPNTYFFIVKPSFKFSF